MGTKYSYLNDEGLLEQVDLETGEITPLESNKIALDYENMKAVRLDSGAIAWVQKDTPLEDLRQIQGKRAHWPYSRFLADLICLRVAEGASLLKICEEPQMPSYGVLSRWRREHPEFEEDLRRARQDRAELLFEEALEVVDQEALSPAAVAHLKLKHEAKKYGARILNPEQFSEKTKVQADVNVGYTTIETGIRRPGDPGFNRDEALDTWRDVTPLEGVQDDGDRRRSADEGNDKDRREGGGDSHSQGGPEGGNIAGADAIDLD